MTPKFLKARFWTLIKWHMIFPLIAFRISFPFFLNHEQRSLQELNEVNPSLCKLIGKAMESHDLQKYFIKDISLCTIWKWVLKILNFTHSRRRAILDLERTPSFEKQSTRFFFSFWICIFWKPIVVGDHTNWVLYEWMGP